MSDSEDHSGSSSEEEVKTTKEVKKRAPKKADTGSKKSKTEKGAKETKKKKVKKVKDPNAPKRGLSAFFYYSKEQRDSVRKDNPGSKVGDIAKILGHQWKELTADEKRPYEVSAATDKARYESEKAAYVPSGDAGSSSSSKKSKPKPKAKAAKKAESESDDDEDSDSDSS
eukprot:TRINITY_DN702_c0_g1_i2.p1 TRINITY_DN702_c0_g1~~TRINITY_DN702_c0_g1_i2.p1  ORF type:complete len:192 (-),score=66.33 TRINITY_DN702_c0_g1_i2:95-604(-)